jgi:hypothetical protein
MFMGLRLCEVVEDEEALDFDALAQQPCGRLSRHGPMTRAANALCALTHAQGTPAKARRFMCARSAQLGNRIDSATIDVGASCLMASIGVFLAV